MNDRGDDDMERSSLSEVDQRVFYQILENTARTAEELKHLRSDLRGVRDDGADVAARVTQNEVMIHKHELALRATQFLIGAIVLGGGGYLWTII